MKTQKAKTRIIKSPLAFGMDVRKIVQKIGKDEGFTLIFEKRSIGLMYNGGAIDITDKVIKAYDKMKQE